MFLGSTPDLGLPNPAIANKVPRLIPPYNGGMTRGELQTALDKSDTVLEIFTRSVCDCFGI